MRKLAGGSSTPARKSGRDERGRKGVKNAKDRDNRGEGRDHQGRKKGEFQMSLQQSRSVQLTIRNTSGAAEGSRAPPEPEGNSQALRSLSGKG